MSRFNEAAVFATVILFVIIAVVLTPIYNSNDDLFGFASSPVYQGYAVPINGIVVDNNLNFASSSDVVQKPVDVSDDIIYRLGYVSYDSQSWTPFNITPSGTQSGEWIYTRGSASLSFTPSKLHLNNTRNFSNNTYIIIYTCSKNTTLHSWSCHDGWQIIPFNAKMNSSGSIITTKTPAHQFITQVSTNTYDTVYNMLPEYSIDGVLSDGSRWSGEGDGAWIEYTFKNSMQLTEVNILFYMGNTRITRFTLAYSLDDNTWTKIGDYSSSGTSTSFETFNFNAITANYFRIIGHGNSDSLKGNWTSIVEVTFINTTTQITCSGSSSQSCPITNGAGIQNRNCSNGNWSTYGACTVTTCNTGYQKSGNACVLIPSSVCGDGTCNTGENCSTCAADCGTCPPPSTTGNTYYVATPEKGGSDNNPGTSIDKPFATWQKGFNALAAGDTLYIRGGTYTGMLGASGSNYFGVRIDGKSGTSSKHITVSAYNNEVPILDGSSLTSTTGSNIGLGLYNIQYWDFIGLTVSNFKQHSDNAYEAAGWYESSVAHITHTHCTNSYDGDGFALKGTHDDIHYTNCDSFENADRYNGGGDTPGGLSNGFYATPGTGNHIYYVGCRAWNNSDDGWDTYNSYGGYIELTNCWAFGNGKSGNTYGDGSGFKLGIINGPKESGIQRTLKNCIAYGNTNIGFDQNSGSTGTIVQIAIYNGVSGANGAEAFNFYYDNQAIIKNTVSYNENLGDVSKSSGVDHDSWQNGLTVSSADFQNVDFLQLARPRKADGSLPDITFMHLVPGSDLIDAGTPISGMPYNGKAPDIGAFETG